MKSVRIILGAVILVMMLATFFYWVEHRQKLNIEIAPAIDRPVMEALRGFWPGWNKFDWDTDSAKIMITTESMDVPQDWQKEVVFEKKLEVSPEKIATLFNDNDGLKLYLAWEKSQEINGLRDYLKKYFNDNPPKELSLISVGDIQLGREVAAKINQYGTSYPFEKTAQVTQNADLTMGNLESPFIEGRANTNPDSMIFGAQKTSVEGLEQAGFDLVNLANNHFLNQGQAGMKLTFDWLAKNNIGYFGAGANSDEAHQPVIKTVGWTKIAFLGYTDSDVLSSGSAATNNRPGVAVMDINTLKEDIQRAKNEADIVIVSMHSGSEYSNNPNMRQQQFARLAISSGANLVIGHHPHVVQGLESVNNKFIYYSLGNFIFDQAWSTETQEGLITKTTFTLDQITKIELIPVRIKDMSQPQIISTNSSEYNSIINRIFMSSEKQKIRYE